jgi:hypothetical protein
VGVGEILGHVVVGFELVGYSGEPHASGPVLAHFRTVEVPHCVSGEGENHPPVFAGRAVVLYITRKHTGIPLLLAKFLGWHRNSVPHELLWLGCWRGGGGFGGDLVEPVAAVFEGDGTLHDRSPLSFAARCALRESCGAERVTKKVMDMLVPWARALAIAAIGCAGGHGLVYCARPRWCDVQQPPHEHALRSIDHSLRWEPGEVIARHVSASEAMHTQAALCPCTKRRLESVPRVPHHISWAHAM